MFALIFIMHAAWCFIFTLCQNKFRKNKQAEVSCFSHEKNSDNISPTDKSIIFQFPKFWSEFWSEKQPTLPMKYVPYFSGKLLNRGCPIIIVTDKNPFYDHFLAVFLPATFISFTKLRFRRPFWGAEQVWIFYGSKAMTQNANTYFHFCSFAIL